MRLCVPLRRIPRLHLLAHRAAHSGAMSVATPKPSASVILLTPSNKVLMVQRGAGASFSRGAHVFPGGLVDTLQGGTIEDTRTTAIRECFEECGVLLTSPPVTSDLPLNEARRMLNSRQTTFSEFLDRYRLTPDVERLHPFSRWITPRGNPKRFDTQFYLYFLGKEHMSMVENASADDKETTSTLLVSPSDALSLFEKEQITLMPPQYYILSVLVQSRMERDTILKLAGGPFGKWVVEPKGLKRGPDGVTLGFPEDEEREGQPGRRHRVVCVPVAGGRGGMRKISLERNFSLSKL